MVTPAHIVPEWYFLPFYAILRTIPDKLGGVVLMVLAIVILLFVPNFDLSLTRSSFFKPFHCLIFWFFVSDSILLGWVGQEVVETPFLELSQIITPFYFIYFILIIPFVSCLENHYIDRFNNFNYNYLLYIDMSKVHPF
jgi:ubiquinol-cytochrome c reductase cytochrome b subunit